MNSLGFDNENAKTAAAAAARQSVTTAPVSSGQLHVIANVDLVQLIAANPFSKTCTVEMWTIFCSECF